MNNLYRRKQNADPFQNLPNEMYFEIFSYLDLPSFRTARAVSKKWKVIADASRKISFSCHLTDETMKTAIKSDEPLSCVKIHDFQGKDNKIVSSTRGTGRIVGCADSIHLIGSNINEEELKKIMKYATDSMIELVFQHCSLPLTKCVFQLRKPFESLQKLTMHLNSYYVEWVKLLQDFGSTQIASQMPRLEHLQMVFEYDPHISNNDLKAHLHHVTQRPFSEISFSHYFTLLRFIIRYKATLKTVKILRDPLMRMIPLTFHLELSHIVLIQIIELVAEFPNLNLSVLHIDMLLVDTIFPFDLETCLIELQRNLKELHVDKRMKIFFGDSTPSESLREAMPTHCTNLTSVKLTLNCRGHEPVDLGLFSQCPRLKTLWLEFLGGYLIPGRLIKTPLMNAFSFTNLEQLPTSITSLHLTPPSIDPCIIHHQPILSLDQVLWIINNLKGLESIWIHLVVDDINEHDAHYRKPHQLLPEWIQLVSDLIRNASNLPLPELVGNEVEEDVQHNADVPLQPIPIQVNQIPQNFPRPDRNVDVLTFRKLISMPNLKDMKFEMLKARYWEDHWEENGSENNTIQMASPLDIEDYKEICEQDPRITFMESLRSESYVGSFIEFVLTRNN